MIAIKAHIVVYFLFSVAFLFVGLIRGAALRQYEDERWAIRRIEVVFPWFWLGDRIGSLPVPGIFSWLLEPLL